MNDGSARDFSVDHLAAQIEGPVAVIGDLHGGAALLTTLLDRLRKTPDFANRWVVFAGDFVDRGPQVRQGLELVLRFAEEHRRVTACMGNHDLAALGAMQLVVPAPHSNWDLRYIADFDSFATFASYGATPTQREFDAIAKAIRRIKPYYDPGDQDYAGGAVPAELAALREKTLEKSAALLAALRESIPEIHRRFLTNLPWRVEHPQYLFVHAGLEPEQPFEEQLRILRARPFDQFTRPTWLHARSLARAVPPHDCPYSVVSGHVHFSEVQFLHAGRRILVDTYGGRGTVLSAVLLPEMQVVTSAE